MVGFYIYAFFPVLEAGGFENLKHIEELGAVGVFTLIAYLMGRVSLFFANAYIESLKNQIKQERAYKEHYRKKYDQCNANLMKKG